MAPGKYSALVRKWNERERRQLLGHALVASTIINVRKRPGERLVTPSELIDGETDEENNG